ncbi:MAG: DUF934 domain-containing protein [Piscinibacter sp.]|uniref:DUF934 domain-containing protein n=1 Tax=Piscinibacter sp. TaxID=1903157 RepID=UPI003D097DA4
MRFIDTHKDRWHALGGEDGPPVSINPAPHLLLDSNQWHAVRAHWPDGVPVGLKLANDEDIEDFAADLPRFGLVALHFPKWVDGRAYSQARLLRSRYRFGGEVRATGEVLVDMVPLLSRTGFDAAVLRHDQSIEAAERAISFFPAHYQGDTRDNRPLFARPEAAQAAVAKAAEFLNAGAAI